jgi:hypothetical protein
VQSWSRVFWNVACSVLRFNLLIVGVEGYCCTWSHSMAFLHSVGFLWTRVQPVAGTSIWQHIILTRDGYTYPGGIRTRNPGKRAAADLRLRQRVLVLISAKTTVFWKTSSCISLDSYSLNMQFEVTGSSETSVPADRVAQRHIPKYFHLNIHHRYNIKSNILISSPATAHYYCHLVANRIPITSLCDI